MSLLDKWDKKEEVVKPIIKKRKSQPTFTKAFWGLWPEFSKSITSVFKARKWNKLYVMWKVIKEEVEAKK